MSIELHPAIVKNIVWSAEDDTQAFARQLANKLLSLQPAAHAFIELHGDLGAGKTTFVRHLLKALGVTGRVKSPTYAVVEPYVVELPNASLNIWHFDFYRFNDPDEWEEAGFRDIFASTGLKLAEWPEKAGEHLPAPDLSVHIELAEDDQRKVCLRALTPRGTELLA